MKKAIISGFALLMLLAGSTVTPAEARYGGFGFHGGGFHGGWGGYRGVGRGLGLGLGLGAVGLGLGALGSSYYGGGYPYGSAYLGNPYGGYDMYSPGYAGGYSLYSAPAGYYGSYGDYWY